MGEAREVPSRLAQQPAGLGLDGFSRATRLYILLAGKLEVCGLWLSSSRGQLIPQYSKK